MMKRRTLIGTLAPLLAVPGTRAQSRNKTWRVGYLVLNRLTEPPSAERAAFLAALRELGYSIGANLAIEYRSADLDREQLPFRADELVQAKVDVIVVNSADAARAALDATKTVPIIMLGVGDPVAFGLATSLARPEANLTGSSWQSIDLNGKRLQLLKEALPRATRLAYLWNPESVAGNASYASAREAAGKNGFVLDELRVTNAQDLQRAIQTLERRRPDALYAHLDSRIAPYRQIIAEAALRLKIPSMSGLRGYVEAGGLMSYAANQTELYRRGASYVDRVLKGARPGDLPIEQPTRFELVINLKTAKALGIVIPGSLRLRADELIE